MPSRVPFTARPPGRIRSLRRRLPVLLGAAALLLAAGPALPATGTASAMAPIASGAAAGTAGDYVRSCPRPSDPQVNACMALRRTDVRTARSLAPDLTPAGFSPSDLELAYQLNTAAGAGTTVAIVDAFDDPNAESDLQVYRSQFSLPACTTANGCFHKVNSSGATSPLPTADTGWSQEISLDLDMVSAACPLCDILLVEAASANDADLYPSVDYAASQAKYVSNSWGKNEFSGETADDVHFNHPGVAITVSTGDFGNDSGPQYPAVSQYVTAVGGTSLARAANARGWTETAWNMANSSCSAFEPIPGWQIGFPTTTCSRRADADVAAVADPATGVAVYDTYGDTGWDVFGGTSAAAPLIAGVYALAGNPGNVDYPAFFPYRHFVGRGPSVVPAENVLNDVTSGSNGGCGAPICTAGPGWDGPTGVGTPIGSGAFAYPMAFGAVVVGNQASRVGTIVNLTLQGVDGTAPYTWSAAGLPPGLSLNPSTGVISGLPNTVGTFGVTITGRDAKPGSAPGVYSFSWTINPPTVATVPDLSGDGVSQARSDLASSFLLLGAVSTVVDNSCNNIGTVIRQSPAAGTQVAAESSVNITIGARPSHPCP